MEINITSQAIMKKKNKKKEPLGDQKTEKIWTFVSWNDRMEKKAKKEENWRTRSL